MGHVSKETYERRAKGGAKVSWRAVAVDVHGKRRTKMFGKKVDADAWVLEMEANRRHGTVDMTVAELGAAHYRHFDGLVRAGLREAATRDGYATTLDVHLKYDPVFAATKLRKLTPPKIQTFLDLVFAEAGSMNVARTVRRTLVAWCAFGQRRGWLASNPAQPCRIEATARTDDEDGCEIPPKADLTALLEAAASGPTPERDTAIVRLLMFGGLRSSELLGLADEAVVEKVRSGVVRVRERLERRYRVLGKVKSARARRDVPVGSAAMQAVKRWRMVRGATPGFAHTNMQGATSRVPGRLFPAPGGGGVWGYQEFRRECWQPLMKRAGLLSIVRDTKNIPRPIVAFAPHALRHVAASLWIEQGLQPKRVQTLLGHSSLQMTMDLYGHLWSDEEADEALAQASEGLIPQGTAAR